MAAPRRARPDAGTPDERLWDFRGRDALAAADRIFTNDMLGLRVGRVRYGPFCDESGKMVGDGTVFRLGDDRACVITALDSDLEHFRVVVRGLDVSIKPITQELPHVQLQGPLSRDTLAKVCDADVAALRYFRFWPVTGSSPPPPRAGRSP